MASLVVSAFFSGARLRRTELVSSSSSAEASLSSSSSSSSSSSVVVNPHEGSVVVRRSGSSSHTTEPSSSSNTSSNASFDASARRPNCLVDHLRARLVETDVSSLGSGAVSETADETRVPSLDTTATSTMSSSSSSSSSGLAVAASTADAHARTDGPTGARKRVHCKRWRRPDGTIVWREARTDPHEAARRVADEEAQKRDAERQRTEALLEAVDARVRAQFPPVKLASASVSASASAAAIPVTSTMTTDELLRVAVRTRDPRLLRLATERLCIDSNNARVAEAFHRDSTALKARATTATTAMRRPPLKQARKA